MDNQTVKRGKGRPRKYETKEKAKEAFRIYKNNYMVNKEWYCEVCNNGKNYTLAGKTLHNRTKKHQRNIV